MLFVKVNYGGKEGSNRRKGPIMDVVHYFFWVVQYVIQMLII